ncbi:hypothetical protein FISHEDRAFT_41531 [Fistulina hepatica ATCC 64428]|nr:hypothetical protein FISHEDRAFT_41531 [Fistulina hepatica ATCC 64428]
MDVQESDNTLNPDSSVESIDRPPSEHLPKAKVYSPYSIYVIALLIPSSIFGLLARLGLEALGNYDGQSIFQLAYAQALGCFVMGFSVPLKEAIGEFYAPLYTAITTGFCGSLTTFSGWQLDVFHAWVNAEHYSRGGFHDFIDGLAQTVFTLCLALGSFKFGTYMAVETSRFYPRIPSFSLIPRLVVTSISIAFYGAVFPAYFRLPASYRSQATAALLFAFPGALLRYILSVTLNHFIKGFPLGTFLANAFGTGLLGAFSVIQGLPSPVSYGSCAILQGLSDGFCGCLTTVSTFAAETITLPTRSSWRYVIVSWVAGQLILLVILGPAFWHGHVNKEATCM